MEIHMQIPNIDFLEARIDGIQKVDDCHIAWSELQDYLGTYDVTEETFSILYDKIKKRYIEITGVDYTTYIKPTKEIM